MLKIDEQLLLDVDTVSGKLKRGVLEHIGRAIATLVLIICAIFTFTEIAFVDISLETFTLEGGIILVLATVMYLSLESEGVSYGKAQEGYVRAKERADALAGQVSGDDFSGLREYLLVLHREEVEARERRMLLNYGLTKEELEGYRRGEHFGKHKSRQLRRVAKSTARALTPNEILFFEDAHLGEITVVPKKQHRFLGLAGMLPSVLCTLLTVGVMVDIKDGFSVGLLLSGILKLSTLLSMGLRGYLAGVHYVNDVLTPYHKVREKLLEAFLNQEISVRENREISTAIR